MAAQTWGRLVSRVKWLALTFAFRITSATPASPLHYISNASDAAFCSGRISDNQSAKARCVQLQAVTEASEAAPNARCIVDQWLSITIALLSFAALLACCA
jgi:hypothetical protein